jgi:hypothetical protein
MPRPKKKNPDGVCKGIGVSLQEDEVARINAICEDGHRSMLLRTWILDALVKEEQRRSKSSPAYLLLGGEQ